MLIKLPVHHGPGGLKIDSKVGSGLMVRKHPMKSKSGSGSALLLSNKAGSGVVSELSSKLSNLSLKPKKSNIKFIL